MKSKLDMQRVVVALTTVVHPMPGQVFKATKEERDRARAAMDVLLWAMDYPNDFNKFADPISQLCPLSDRELEEAFKEAITDYENEEDGTHTE